MTKVVLKRSVRRNLTSILVVGVLVMLVVVIVKVNKTNKDMEMEKLFQSMTELGDKIGWLVPMTTETQQRIDQAKSLQFDGEHKQYLSEALIDLLGFGSSCGAESSVQSAPGNSQQPKKTLLLLHSSPIKTELRGIIRRTWANPSEQAKHGVVLRFVMGRPTELGQIPVLVKESMNHGDILIGNFTDNRRSSTVKTLLTFRWAVSFCSGFDFVLQASDETFMWLDKLPKILQSFKGRDMASIVGYRSNTSRVIHDTSSLYNIKSKILENKEFYPPYCSFDSGIVMPFSFVGAIYRFAWKTDSLVPFADALFGLVAQTKGWNVRHSLLFNLLPIDMAGDACSMSTRFTMRDPKDIQTLPYIWKNLKDARYMKDCHTADLDVIYAGIKVDNVKFFKSVLKPIREHSNHVCEKEENIFMVGLVSSHPEQFNARQVIRDTWASETFLDSLKRRVKVFFLIGKPLDVNPTLKLKLDEEFELYGDILEGNFTDSFKNLTLKHLFGLAFTAKNCGSVKYLFKSDDDVFANLDNVVNLLLDMNARGQGLRELYMGNGGVEERNGMKDKNYHVSSSEYDGKMFPAYCVGGGYVLSMDLVPRAFQEALRTPLISSLDDVYVGILMKKLGIQIEYHDGFLYTMGKTDKCSLRAKDFMVMHVHRKPDDIRKIWENFMDPDVTCPELKR